MGHARAMAEGWALRRRKTSFGKVWKVGQAVLSVLDVRFTHLLFEHRREGQSREALLGASSKSLSFKIGPMVADLPCETRKQGTLSRSICTHKQR